LALLLLLWLGFRSWSRRKERKAVDIGRLETAYPSADSPDSDQENLEDQAPGLTAAPGDETDALIDEVVENPVAEADAALADADFHISYGLYDDAVDILKEAMASSPKRRDLQLKLLEAYYGARDSQSFSTLAGKVREDMDESDPDWERIAGMSDELASADPLFSASSEESQDTAAPVEEEPQALDLSAYQPSDVQATSPEEANRDEEAPVENASEGLGFDHEAGFQKSPLEREDPIDEQLQEDDKPDADATPASGEAASGKEDKAEEGRDWRDAPLDFDLGDQGSESASDETETADEERQRTPGEDIPAVEMDLDSPAESRSEPPAESDTVDQVPEFDIDAFLEDRMEEASSAVDSNESLSEPAGEPAHEEEDTTAGEISDLDSLGSAGNDEDFDLDDLLGGDEKDDIGTKLDLARTYLDMGDSEMAKSLLDTIAEQGDEAQREEAVALRERIG